ncbi:uncharacterized protein LOC129749749 [Uranotaenia lowii]|uniref:uncharacterized protein LOC129749749 n=1 Tax=Uranotaenia lowii TaxID=190385 RepID=UPI00247AC970|nr:uncharacterized protein LOC129749749 [Uranotaenia lowii]XP_055600792.1 uncharacterized protein LOC129749749 [Uranotaenia lowii]XP_055600793.1 uncharacterized protein LOC129749749 [Uranotaenia lowii]
MASSISANGAAASNGNGVHKTVPFEAEKQPSNITLLEPSNGTTTAVPVAATAILSPPQQRPPRKLSFDDTEMELSRLKLGSTRRKLPGVVLALAACCAIVGLIFGYLLPFDTKFISDTFAASLATAEQWQQAIVQRTVLSFQDSLPRYQEAFQSRMNDTLAQFQDPSVLLLATLFGAGVTWFTYFVVYLDSSIPGVNPPTPFSASKKKNFSDKERRFHLGYVTALLSGLTVFMIILLVE